MHRTTVLGLLALSACTAFADQIPIINSSFATLPTGGLNYAGCGTGCSYSETAPPGWSMTGLGGQFQPGVQDNNYSYFNYIPNGITLAWLDSGALTQTTSATVQSGVTYTLQVDLGAHLGSGFSTDGIVDLVIGSTLIQATGTTPTAGNWSVYTATYTGTNATAGESIGIELTTTGTEGDFNNVALTDSIAVPEPSSWILLTTLAALLTALASLRNSR